MRARYTRACALEVLAYACACPCNACCNKRYDMECLAGLMRISLNATDPRDLLQTANRLADTQARLSLFALEV